MFIKNSMISAYEQLLSDKNIFVEITVKIIKYLFLNMFC